MNKPAASDLTITNGQITREVTSFITYPQQQLIYEVFRIYKGHPVFLDDHLTRLFNSIRGINHCFNVSGAELKRLLLQLIKQSDTSEGNIKIEICFNNGEIKEKYYRSFFIPTSYPDEIMYKEGVSCNFLEAERENPSVKMANPKLRNLSDSIILKENIYETILINKAGYITEGSRSNLFFIKSGKLFTAPDSMVLQGIMRQKITQLIKDNNIPIEMNPVRKEELDHFDACFITGTSPRVLPIKKIEEYTFKVPDELTMKISYLINELIDQHIKLQQ